MLRNQKTYSLANGFGEKKKGLVLHGHEGPKGREWRGENRQGGNTPPTTQRPSSKERRLAGNVVQPLPSNSAEQWPWLIGGLVCYGKGLLSCRQWSILCIYNIVPAWEVKSKSTPFPVLQPQKTTFFVSMETLFAFQIKCRVRHGGGPATTIEGGLSD